MNQRVSDILVNNLPENQESTSQQDKNYQEKNPIQGESSEKEGIGILSPSWLLMFFLLCINELIDYIGLLLNVTGFWEIIIIIIDLFYAGIFFLWRQFLAPKTGKGKLIAQIILIILEFVPIVGDILPGWIITMFMYM